MTRLNFTSQTKREAYKRSQGICECHRIPWMVACGQPLSAGNIFYEHINPDHIVKNNSLDNCAALTKTCWRIKTDSYDRKVIKKNNHQQDRNRNIKPKSPREFAGSRRSRFKSKMSGDRVWRDSGRSIYSGKWVKVIER